VTSGGAVSEDFPFAISGERLQAWFFTMDGGGAGTSVFSTFRDSLLDVDCSFAPAVMGDAQICAPNVGVDVVYLDSACSEPGAQVAPWSDALPAWVHGTDGSSPTTRRYYRSGELVFAGGGNTGMELPQAFVRAGGQCSPTMLWSGHEPSSLYRLSEVPESTFVAARTATRSVGGGFSVERLVADDGTELTRTVLDRDENPCQLQPDGVCVPMPYAESRGSFDGIGAYLDASCTEPAFVLVDPGPRKLAVERDHGTSHVYELTTPATAYTKSYLLDANHNVVVENGVAQYTCEPGAPSDAFALGGEVTSQLSRSARLDVTIDGLRWFQLGVLSETKGGEMFSPLEASGAFLDDQGLGCRASITTAGELVWVALSEGGSAYASDRFSDASCTQPLYALLPAVGAGTPAEIIPTLRGVDARDTANQKLFSLKAHSGRAFAFNGTECVAADSALILLEVDREWALPHFTRARR
jgi:hypothetical protein